LAQDRVPSLLTTTPVTREIAGSEVHSYGIAMAAGDYLNISIRLLGADLVCELLLPDESLATVADTSHGPGVPASIAFVAEVAGDYTLRVRPSKTDAPLGRYQIEMTGPRIATTVERGRFLAQKAFDEGRRLALTNAAEQNKLAIASYGRAMELFREIGDRKGELTAMIAVAESHVLFGDPQEALDTYRQAIRCAHESGERYSEANIHLGVGRIEAISGNHQEALSSYNTALEIYEGMSARYGAALALTLTGSSYRSLGDDSAALALYQRALPTFESLGDLHNLGTLLNLIGQAYVGLGESTKALEFHARALKIAREQDLYRLEAPTLVFLGDVHLLLGEKAKAVEEFRQSLKVSQTAGLRDNEALALRSIAGVELADGNLEAAHEMLIRALEIFRILERNPQVLKTLHSLARTHFASGKLNEARREIEEALQIGESIRSQVLGHELRESFFAAMQNCFQLYIEILMRLDRASPGAGLAETALSASERARARSLLELLDEAGVDLREGVPAELLAHERNLQNRMNAKAAAREKMLGDKTTAVQAAAFETEIAGLASKYRDIEAQIRSASPAYAALTQPQPLPAAEIRKLLDESTVLLEYFLGEEKSWLWAVTPDRIESYQLPPRDTIEKAARQVCEVLTSRRLRSNAPEPARRGLSAKADRQFRTDAGLLSEILFGSIAQKLHQEWKQARLAIVASGALEYTPFAALPEPGGGDYRPLLLEHEIVTLPSASTLALLRGRSSQVSGDAKTLAVLADPVVDAHDPRLSQAKSAEVDVGQPASAEPAGSVAADGTRAEPGRPLTRNERRSWRGGFTRLPFSHEEADRITAFVPEGAFFKGVGFEANRGIVMSGELSRYRMVHFATHGLLNGEHPELSGLVLSLFDRYGKPQDGFLRLNEIYNLKMPADIVVLSACQTALGKEIRGEGMIGLTRGFMYAGARRVVASLWQIDDLATADLMGHFYKGMLKEGMRPGEALRKAQLTIARRKRWASPYFWAGFTLQGEWR
jgi:CHAT domain-containing protein/tetratricopeptide (TPR) repeat protein